MSNKEVLLPDENGAYPCKICNRKHQIFYPKYFCAEGLVYARCSNPSCDKYSPYEFIGTNKTGAIRHWNYVMQHNDAENLKEDE